MKNMNSKIIFVCGSTGAGKTTYSQKLSRANAAVRFSIDEWMKTLFWMDAPKDGGADYSWAIERVERCETMIRALVSQLVEKSTNVVLDLGFSNLEQRERYYQWARDSGYSFELHFLDIPQDIRWKRVELRNQALDQNSIPVDRKTFDWMENYFEKPSGEELDKNNGSRLESFSM